MAELSSMHRDAGSRRGTVSQRATGCGRYGRIRAVSVLLAALAVLGSGAYLAPRSAGAVVPSGSVYTWFDDDAGQLCDGIVSVTNNVQNPAPSRFATSTAVAAGQSHTLAVDPKGAVYACGFNQSGQLGDGTTTSTTSPVKSALPQGLVVTAVAAGWKTSLALTTTGAVYAWGLNKNGQIGDGSHSNRTTPVRVHLPAGVTATAIAEGIDFSLAVTSTGSVYAWGDNTYGQLGNGTSGSIDVPVPALVSLPAGVVATAVGAGDTHGLVVTSTGSIYAFGRNSFGQLGNGSTNMSTVPVLVSLPTGVVATQVAAGGVSPTTTGGGDYSMAVASDGKVYSWGANGRAQLGDGTTTNSSVPVLTHLPSGVVATAVGGGPNFGHALTSDGNVYEWGKGKGATFLVPAAAVLPTGLRAVAVSAGADGEQTAAVMASSPDPLTSLTITPTASTIAAGGTQTYRVTGYDRSGNSLGDVTGSTGFVVTNGTCAANVCGSSTVGKQTVTATDGTVTTTAVLTVSPAPVWSAQAIQPKAVTGVGPGATALNAQLWITWRVLTTNQVAIASYDPTTTIWTAPVIQPVGSSNSGPGIAALNGKLYVVWTGRGGTADQIAISAYDPVSATWTTISYDNQALSADAPAVAAFNGRLWVAWKSASGNQIGYASYDPAAGTWSAPALHPQATTAYGPALAVVGTFLYLGWTTTGGQVGYSIYDPTGGTWSAQAVQPVAATLKAGPTLTASGGLLYAAWTTSAHKIAYTSYDPVSALWSATALQPQASADHGPALTHVGSKLALVWQVQSLNELAYSFYS